jgi:hypothetical protein
MLLNRIIKLTVFTLLITASFVNAQHHELSDKPEMWKGKNQKSIDSNSLFYAFKAGEVNGHFRYFLSNTINDGALTDYYANAVGGGLRYETAKFHGFQFAVSGFYFFNLYSSDLEVVDSLSGQANRYEIGLFDVENPTNKKDLDRIEELYLKYSFRKGQVIVGRQLINTPMINLQDGRMRGTGVEGIWLQWMPHRKWELEGGWIYAISPRSTTKWFYVEESIGLFPSGVNTSGKKSVYKDELESRGVGVLSARFKPLKSLEIQVWDYFIENILNSAFVQADYTCKLSEKNSFLAGAQFIRQNAVNDGGNQNQELTYVDKGSKAMTFGGKLGFRSGKIEYSVNYNHITGDGRYLMPREWGRDPFYTFLARERNEGFGKSSAIMLKAEIKEKKNFFRSSVGAGYVRLPDVQDVAFNKYGMPSYYQVNFDVRYNWSRFVRGLESQLLVVAKFREGETYNQRKYEINKVNMLLINAVLNYHF